MQTIVSGVQPSGIPHLGNYFGAMKQHIEMSNNSDIHSFIFIADLHALTTIKDPTILKEFTRNLVIDYLALGLNPNKATFFKQSDVPAHNELAWILSCLTPFGLLERAHAWKDNKAKGIKTPTVGLFNYPILMSADILIYKPDLIPVGKDQKQHVEITRDIAKKFNKTYVEIFPIPDVFTPKNVEVIPGTDGQKMSKSYNNTIELFADEKTLKKQIMSIVTDSIPIEDKKDPEKCNVFQIFKLFLSEKEQKELANRYKNGGLGYGEVKKMLLACVLDYFTPYRTKRVELKANLDYIDSCLEEGAKKANKTANSTLYEVKKTIGLI